MAESSVTIDGVGAVVDSGLARVARHSPWSGLPELMVSRISQASADQRAGRAGRTGPGLVIRLYPREDFVRRPAHDTPEILREDLAPAGLLLRAMGLRGFGDLDWLDVPPAAAVGHADALLRQLGAIDAAGALTPVGREMARYPLHPRLARLVVESARRGAAEEGATVAALLSTGRPPALPAHATRSDLLALLEAERDPRAAQVVRRVRLLANPAGRQKHDEEGLLVSVLAAFPDRVARRRQGNELLLASGGAAELARTSTVGGCDFLVAVEAEDRSDRRVPLVRLASGIEPEWLLDLFPDRVRETTETEWNRTAERVECVSALRFDALVIQESRGAPEPEAAARLLAAKAMEAGPGRFAGQEELDAFQARAAFAAAHGNFTAPGPDDLLAALEELATGLRSFAELEAAARAGRFLLVLERRLPAGRLEEIAPSRIRLPGGRQVKVHYEPGQPPWIESRLQDFFGMKETPRVARGAVPVVVRLLAPNHRPVQTTTDLGGFWRRLYPQVRRELMRRYPRHAWPEDPG